MLLLECLCARSIKVFSEKEVELVLAYFTDSFYRHFSLYKYIFTPLNRVVLRQCGMNEVERPRNCAAMLPLNEAFHIQTVAPPSPLHEEGSPHAHH